MNAPKLPKSISTTWLLQHQIAPINLKNGILTVHITENCSELALDVLSTVTNSILEVEISDIKTIEAILMEQAAVRLEIDENNRQSKSIQSQIQSSTLLEANELLADDPDHPVTIQIVNSLISNALSNRASDIHLEPEKNVMKVRFRIDGILEDRTVVASEQADSVVNRIKVMARMDVSNRITPQDGACSVTFGGAPVDIRVSSVPTPIGERLVLRLLGRSNEIADLQRLGLPSKVQADLISVLNQTQGMLLVAGPTGSGKSTTLYACLEAIDTSMRNVITIEDPVEYDLPGISQVQVGQDRQMTFGQGLRSLLRQDPDIIMVGEIRDGDTAGIAHQAALTGHLILSTIHTMDPAAAVIRLLDLGVEPALIAETLSAVMDQRLVRRLCPHCKDNGATRNTTIPFSSATVGCVHCRDTGYLGRTGLFRYISSTPELKQAIRRNDHQAVREIVDMHCTSMLQDQARDLIDQGITNQQEIDRVLGCGDIS